MDLIGLEVMYRLPFAAEHKRSTIIGLTKTLDGQDVLVLDNGDLVIKGSQIICPSNQQQIQPAC